MNNDEDITQEPYEDVEDAETVEDDEPYGDAEGEAPDTIDAGGEELLDAHESGDGARDPRGPDVHLDVPVLQVEEIDLEVEDLRARVSLQAEVLDLLKLNVGADVSLDRVHLNVKGVEAQAELTVRLDNVATILNRVLATIDRNPQILEQLTRGVGAAAEEVGSGAGRAVGELGRGAGEAVEDVGRGAGGAVEDVGRGAGEAVEDVGRGAGEAVEDVGRGAGGAVEDVGGSAGEAVEDVGRGTGEAVEGAGEAAGAVSRSAGKATENVGDEAGEAVGKAAEDVGDAAGEAAGDAAEAGERAAEPVSGESRERTRTPRTSAHGSDEIAGTAKARKRKASTERSSATRGHRSAEEPRRPYSRRAARRDRT
jgi:hypothetical protein